MHEAKNVCRIKGTIASSAKTINPQHSVLHQGHLPAEHISTEA